MARIQVLKLLICSCVVLCRNVDRGDSTATLNDVVGSRILGILRQLGDLSAWKHIYILGRPAINSFIRCPTCSYRLCVAYFSELSILDYKALKFVPFMLAASAVFLARFIICPKQHPWNHMLDEHTKYKAADLQLCLGIIHDLYLSKEEVLFRISERNTSTISSSLLRATTGYLLRGCYHFIRSFALEAKG
ncbi:unnamed protein product [Microthlaspi erraticum]|uniref:Cyclin C-terminal domain-containing protein n=1 Tax=Microthlaspi erraticum TaxID=1685480 RepID=A0A6D2JGZ4_9BRAS|nr:unnamed protein product [Microthlaspi erraticum]